MKIAEGLYRATQPGETASRRPHKPETPGSTPGAAITPGHRWYTAQVERGRREAQHLARRRGWGLAGRFPQEAMEAE